MWLALQYLAHRAYPLKYDLNPIATAVLIAGVTYTVQALFPDLSSPWLTRIVRLGIVTTGLIFLALLVLVRYPRSKTGEGAVSEDGDR